LYSVPTYVFTSIDTNCTLPQVPYNYISGPNLRSTPEIAWSSLATIIACAFTVSHLNVPEQRDGRDPSGKRNIKWWMESIRPTLQWAAISIVAPELLRLECYKHILCCQGNSDMSREHALYINMGGHAIRL
jgi:hypothetical protein